MGRGAQPRAFALAASARTVFGGSKILTGKQTEL
jgi:hypothetical protein